MARRPVVRWNEGEQRWMAWVRFPDGSRRRVKRLDKRDAQRDLEELLALRASNGAPQPKRERLASFDEILDAWFADGCPTASPTTRSRHARQKSPNTITNARYLLDKHVRPTIGSLRVDRTTTARLEDVFITMAAAGYSTSTVDRTWLYVQQACQWALRRRLVKVNPVADVLLPTAKASKPRRSLSIEQAQRLLAEAIPHDRRPALWLTGLMCGLRPGELSGLRWPYVDLNSRTPTIEVAERALEVDDRYVGQAEPKTARGRRRIEIHPLLVAALRRHRREMEVLDLYAPEGFVFCTRQGAPLTLNNLRRDFRQLCERAGLGPDWTTYELRHTFVSLVADQLDDLVKVADLVGHSDIRTTQGYRHPVRHSLPHAVDAWNRLLEGAATS